MLNGFAKRQRLSATITMTAVYSFLQLPSSGFTPFRVKPGSRLATIMTSACGLTGDCSPRLTYNIMLMLHRLPILHCLQGDIVSEVLTERGISLGRGKWRHFSGRARTPGPTLAHSRPAANPEMLPSNPSTLCTS